MRRNIRKDDIEYEDWEMVKIDKNQGIIWDDIQNEALKRIEKLWKRNSKYE